MADAPADRIPTVTDPFPQPDEGPDAGAPLLRPRRRRRRAGRWIAAVLVAALAVAVAIAAPWNPQNRQAWADQWVVWTEPPPERIEQLAVDLTLTETGRRIFFASRPQLDGATDFQDHCPLEGGVVLGCYGGGGIFIYEVTDERLSGTVEATAAHELLHAVYDRMSRDDRARVDAIVAEVVASLPEGDPNIATVAGYAEKQHADEWHSRIGTGYLELPAELEEHYARIFADRSRVVAFEKARTAQIDEYSARIEQLSAELDAGLADLEQRSAAYDAAIAELDTDIEDFNRRADTVGAFPSQEAFQRERAKLLERQEALEQERVQLNADVDAYNAKIEELKSLDAQRAELYSQLDSRSAPAT
ncbi:hypothetical protein H4J02_06015 [Protaetiibacter sp. SSC-01]|uniref:hypothetical protein n=1 Tax=Protaetiibacter sp. SSC-01 TaxID=2759943 RepID=UPI001656D8D5|nr:hypothetical protein [Protaetiibacter sp. SSC-01]QNO38553.1 hypothetical protein H4J02_06015 [Protaetiibacter sp. SSC-01]